MSLNQLPSHLRYLEPLVDSLFSKSVSSEESIAGLEITLRQRIRGLSLEDAEERLETDAEDLREWTNEQGEDASPACSHLALIFPFVAADLIQEFELPEGDAE